MLSSNNTKSSNNITNCQVANKSDKYQVLLVTSPVSNDVILQYPFVDGSDFKAMMSFYDRHASKWNIQAKTFNQLLKEGSVKGEKRPVLRSQHRRTYEGLISIFASDLKKEANKHLQFKSINNPFGLASHSLDSTNLNVSGFANRTYEINGERYKAQEINKNTVRNHLKRFANCGIIEHTSGGKWQNAKITIFPKFLQISDRSRETKQKTQTLGFEGCQTQNFSVFTLSSYINKSKKEIKAFKEFSPKSENKIIAIAQTPAVGFTGTLGQGNDSFEKSTLKNQTGGRKIIMLHEYLQG